MNDADLVIIYVGLISYIGAIVQGITTFGDAIVMHMLWHIAILVAPDVMRATPYVDSYLVGIVLILSVRSVFVQAVFVLRSLDFMNKPLLVWLLPAQGFTILIGAVILDKFSTSWWLGVSLGIIFLVAAVVFGTVSARKVVHNRRIGHVPQHRNHKEYEITMRHKLGMTAASLIGGVLTGIAGVGGPPMMIASVMLDVPQPVLRGTFPFTALAGATVRFVASLVYGLYSADACMLYVAACIGAFAGLFVGIELSGRIAHDTFIFSVCWLMMFGAVALMQLSGWLTVLSLALCMLSFAALQAYSARAARHREIGRGQPPDLTTTQTAHAGVRTADVTASKSAPMSRCATPVARPQDFVSRGEAPQVEDIDDIDDAAVREAHVVDSILQAFTSLTSSFAGPTRSGRVTPVDAAPRADGIR
jgi:hypothetical protein